VAGRKVHRFNGHRLAKPIGKRPASTSADRSEVSIELTVVVSIE
jgi:hypothetical protein